MASQTTLTGAIAAAADAVIAEAETLNRLDGVAGDGDLGVTTTAAANALKAIVPDLAAQDLATALKRCGSEIARKAPSTCGTLIATGFLRAGRAAGETAFAGAVNDTARAAVLLAAAQQGIQERGKAAPGEKSLLDALAPAVDTLREGGAAGEPLPPAFRRAANAAAAGAAATKEMRAKVGRAGWLADRSQGSEDAGAHLIALLFAAAARHLNA
jgi:dihydroxyacetone kinase-like protein